MDASPEHPIEPTLQAPAGPGTVIGGRYRLETRLAAGGMASVWEAHDEVLARQVAVKVLHPHLAADDQFVARFKREAVAAARLGHPSIVAIYDTCSEGETEAIVMELVRGTTLRAELDRRGRFPSREAAHIVAEIADALATAHSAGIVHRDVKPANVLLSRDGRVLVTDFGIAKAADGLDLTGTDTTLGTAKYLAPEQVDTTMGPLDARADVYAAGVILYELVCGQPPFLADTEAATALARLHRDPAPPHEIEADVDPAVEQVVLQAMARQPAQRLRSAAVLRDALRAVAEGRPLPPAEGPPTQSVAAIDATAIVDGTRVAPAPPAPVPTPASTPAATPPPPRRRPRRWAPAVLGAIAAVAVVVAGVLWVRTGDGGGNGGDAAEGATTGPVTGAVPIVAVHSFDPEDEQGGQENEDDVGLVTDQITDTTWRTSCYTTGAFGNLKSGLGIIVELGDVGSLDQLVVDSPNAGWTAEAYVAESAPDDKAGWGEPVDSRTGTAGRTTFDLHGTDGGAVLLWFTGLGDSPSPACDERPFGVSVAELAVV